MDTSGQQFMGIPKMEQTTLTTKTKSSGQHQNSHNSTLDTTWETVIWDRSHDEVAHHKFYLDTRTQ